MSSTSTPPPLPSLPPTAAGGHQARHLFALPADVEVDEVETLALSRFAGARWDVAPAVANPASPVARTARPGEPGVLRTSRHSTLSGPYAPSPLPSAASPASGSTSGLPHGTATVFDVVCPRERGEAPYPGGGDRDGIGRAFPAALPIREEERLVSWLVAAARRLGGSVLVDVDDPVAPRVLLTPDAAAAVDMCVYSDVWLDPQAALMVLAAVHARTTLATEGTLWQGPPKGITEPSAEPGEPGAFEPGAALDPEMLRDVHGAADDVDISALTSGQVLDGYGLVIDLDVDGMIAVEVGGEERLPLLLRGLPWTTQGAVAYRVRWEPADLVESQLEHPPIGHQVARKRAAQLVASLTRALHDVVGGEIADDADFLVDPLDL